MDQYKLALLQKHNKSFSICASIKIRQSITVNRDDVAGPEGVSGGSMWATAHRDVVGDSTDGLKTTSAGTGVLALVADTSSVHCAV